ncbi:SH3 domain-containing protein [Flavobacterium sp. RSP15]|uniref:SH3 domain-containing protein n=1 Tax=Flavobacterium sp. RSP15 TaxID=2497485 RepID=UPI000F81EA50|nr:SH3 domain-containing protein [Flavobacterium sp. RSP15]RTY86949.1 SH3 domain-containing protein [Flavobacterium sp. RSP15]
MKLNIILLLLTFNLVFSSNSDTITAISIKNINLRENATTDSKVLTEIKQEDTLIITETENGWSKAIYKDSLKGFVKSEYLSEITSKRETLKLHVLNILFKSYFFKALLFISALCFGFLYLLKRKLVQLDILGNFSLVLKSFLIGFIFTIIGTLYYFYDLFSFFTIVGIGILIIILYYRISSIFKIEKKIKDDKLIINNNSKENLKEISKEILREQITNENNKLNETEINLETAINKTNEVKGQQFNLIKEKLIELYGAESVNELVNYEKPFVGLHKVFLDYFIGNPEKINESSDANNKWETYFYDKINNRGNDGTFRLKINIQNDLVTSFQLR